MAEDTSSTQTIKSVFDYEYIPTSKAIQYNIANTGYFTIDTDFTTSTATEKIKNKEDSKAKINGIILNATNSSGNVSFSNNTKSSAEFWQIIIHSMSEVHEESYSLHNTISDSVSIFATGAKHIAVTIGGSLLVSGSEDYAYVFLKKYVEDFRARHLSANDKHLLFVLQDTEFNLVLQSISLGTEVTNETYVSINISGLAYQYRLTNSTESLLLTYYGKGNINDSKVSTNDKPANIGKTTTGTISVNKTTTTTSVPPYQKATTFPVKVGVS